MLLLDDAPVLEQQVDVPEHLGERQVGLRDRDVPPQLEAISCAVRGSLGDQAEDPLGAARVQAQALVDQRAWSVIGSAVTGEHELELHRARLLQRVDVAEQRLRARAACTRRLRARAGGRADGFEEMCAIRWSPASSSRARLVEEDRVRGAVAGAVEHPQRAVAQLSSSPSRERRA